VNMNKKLIPVTENSNIEINDESIELLLQGICKSYECSDFRNNNCRMKTFIDSFNDGSWKWSQTWMTPTKFFLHIIKYGDNPTQETQDFMEEVKKSWNCLESDIACECNFFEEMKKLNAIITNLLNTKS